MKANQAFRSTDDAVSPVIAVILMVAITVVLAATVYVWVSGFGSQSGSPAKSLSLTSNGAYDTTADVKEYVVASATNGMKYGDMLVTIDGAQMAFDDAATDGTWYVQRGTSYVAATAAVVAGDVVHLDALAADGPLTGKSVRILDAQANSIILTLTVT